MSRPCQFGACARTSLPLAAALNVLAIVSASTPALAQSSSASYQVPRQSVDGGATRSASASYSVEATVGQPDAAPEMTSTSYRLRGGFHRPAAGALPDPLFANGFE